MPVTEEPKTIGENANGGEFKEGLCSCGGDCGSCMKATFCPCFVAKDVAEHMGESGSLWCALYFLGCCIGSLVSCFESNPDFCFISLAIRYVCVHST